MTLQENIEKFADSVKAGNLQRRYWMVRTNSGTYFDLFVEKGYVALNRNDIPYKAVYDANQEYDKPDLVVKKVKQTIKESVNFNNSLYADERALSVAVSQVYKFVYDIHKKVMLL